MGAILDSLYHLQSIDHQLRAVREQIESKRRGVSARRRKVATLERQIVDQRQQVQQAQAEADRVEMDRQSREAHIAKLREALNRAKTNREYAALLTELNTEKADATKLENAALAGMERVEELQNQMSEFVRELDKARLRAEELAQELASIEQRLEGQISDLEEKRQAASEQISPEWLTMFERACDKHEGEAMARIEKVHPRHADYICSGCHMSIPLETVNALQSKDTVKQCHNCNRILYLDVNEQVIA